MFTTLIASQPASQRSMRNTLVSVATHATVLTIAIVVTANSGQRIAFSKEEIIKIHYARPEPAHPAAPTLPQAPLTASPMPDRRFDFRTQPIADPISSTVPDVALPTPDGHTDFPGHGSLGNSSGTSTLESPLGSGDSYLSSQVDKPAVARAGNPAPRYPSALEQSRVEGEVLVQFVVDTVGAADMSTFRVLRSSNDLFTASITTALAHWRFIPAESQGRRVRQIVLLPLRFIAPAR